MKPTLCTIGVVLLVAGVANFSNDAVFWPTDPRLQPLLGAFHPAAMSLFANMLHPAAMHLAGNERLKAAGWEPHGDGSGYWCKGTVSHVHRDEALKEVAWQAGEASEAAQEAAVAPLASPAGEGSGIQFVTRKDPGAPDGMVTHEARLPLGRGEYVRHCVRLPNDASETTVAAWHRVLAGHVMRKAHPPSSNSVTSDDLLVTFRPILGVVQPCAL